MAHAQEDMTHKRNEEGLNSSVAARCKERSGECQGSCSFEHNASLSCSLSWKSYSYFCPPGRPPSPTMPFLAWGPAVSTMSAPANIFFLSLISTHDRPQKYCSSKEEHDAGTMHLPPTKWYIRRTVVRGQSEVRRSIFDTLPCLNHMLAISACSC